MSTLKVKPSAKTSYHHGNLTIELKKQTLKIIKAKGVSNLSLRGLATQCGVSATAVYRHYKSKDHLLADIALDGFLELQKVMLKTEEPNKFQKAGIAYVQHALLNPVKFNLMFSGIIKKNEHPALHKASIDAYQILRNHVESGTELGYMIGDVDTLTRAAWATVHGTATLLIENQFSSKKQDIKEGSKIALEITDVLKQGLCTIKY